MGRELAWMAAAVFVSVAAALVWQHYGPEPPHPSPLTPIHSDWAELRNTMPPARYP